MHEHDLDLIAEYASGLLSGEHEARAADLAARCTVCAEEMGVQRQVRTLLSSSARPEMTTFERSRLHRIVLEAVAPAPATATMSRWDRRWLSLAGAAAALVVIVGGAGVVGMLGGADEALDGSSTAGARVAADLATDTTTAAATEMAPAAAQEESAGASTLESYGMGGGLPWFADLADTDRDVFRTVVDEMRAVAADQAAIVTAEDAAGFGAVCFPVDADAVYAVILARIDGAAYETFLTGDRADPTVVTVTTEGCRPVDP